MYSVDFPPTIDSLGLGPQIDDLVCRLYPICRSITGEGVRQTLRIIQEHIPLEIHEVPTGTSVLDWTIPKQDRHGKDGDMSPQKRLCGMVP